MTVERLKRWASKADEQRWAAVLNRDPGQDGRFVYAVSSTGVYCRPTCPSRRPTPNRVTFFPTPDAAEAEGYRACRRCEPRSIHPGAVRQVERAREYLEQHLTETVSLRQLGKAVGLSPYHLQRTFKRFVGVTPKAYANARRLQRMKSRLKEGDTVSRATYEAGYGSGSRAYEQANAGLGMTPGAYRNGGRGTRIEYATLPTAFGTLLAAATDRGVCAVMLGDDAATLESALRREYPAAEIERGEDKLKQYTDAILNRLAGKSVENEVPLDVPGSTFQWQVWEALRRIPSGETRSYQTIAKELGRPTAARAVARACASNRVALMIPCHRAVRENGEMGGYRWGIDRKERLLDQERARGIA
jgi:AraC family transcriptional regulator of adaptative response/methylated-DNA-[protein]-cysteine methyltransferase